MSLFDFALHRGSCYLSDHIHVCGRTVVCAGTGGKGGTKNQVHPIGNVRKDISSEHCCV